MSLKCKVIFLWLGLIATSLAAKEKAEPIDRHALVTRHNIECNLLATTLPLGNGEFCFNADATGLQTFAGNAMSHWCWHSFPGKDDLRPLNLGRLRLCHGDGSAVTKKEITAVKRTLDLWSGTQTAQFEIAGQPVRVETCVDAKNDAVAVRIESPLLARGEILVTLDFPYAWKKEEPWLGEWSQPELHTTKLTRHGQRVADFGARWMKRPIMSAWRGPQGHSLRRRPARRTPSGFPAPARTGSTSSAPLWPRRSRRSCPTWEKCLTKVAGPGKPSGARAARSICPAARIRVGASWNDA